MTTVAPAPGPGSGADARGGFSGGQAFTTRPVIRGFHGVVASGHYLAAEIGQRVLEAGGNAIDAGVASVFALTLVKPQSAGIAGECPILVYHHSADASLPNPVSISGNGTAPRRATIEWFEERRIAAIPGDGLLSALVPATFDACLVALQRFGRLGVRETLGPVVELAADGFALYPAFHNALNLRADRYRDEYPTTGAIFLDRGAVPDVGWRIRQPAWAATFGRLIDAEAAALVRGADRVAGIQAARDGFYRGFVADEIARFLETASVVDATGSAHEGLLTREDLASYETLLETPATVRYHGIDVHKCGPWTQGPVFLQQLTLLDGFDLPALRHNSADYIHVLIEAAKLAFADRERWYGDPRYADVPLARLLSPDYAHERRTLIDMAVASGEIRPGDAGPTTPPRVTPDPRAGNGDTTHVSVADAEGNLFAATPSGGWLESSPIIPSLGFPLGSRLQVFNLDPTHPNSLAPGKRPRTTLTPSLATRDGQPYLAFGTPGGDQQDQWTLQFFLNLVDFGMDLQEAIDAPVVHTLHFPSSFYPHETFLRHLVAESRIPGAVLDDLAARGHLIETVGDWASGEVSAVRFEPSTGLIEGASSPRARAAYAIGR
jgi:gamma-glutamyltranspeptidase/glutathione hydrolase